MEKPIVVITEEMIKKARALEKSVEVKRTKASNIDTITGILGEFVFAEYFYDDWKKNKVGMNKGDLDFDGIEIKTSAYPFSENLNLLVREDYGDKRKPPFYIQIIISVEDRMANEIKEDTKAYICGFTTSEEVEKAPKKDFGSKRGGRGGYSCYYIPIRDLHPMADFRKVYNQRH